VIALVVAALVAGSVVDDLYGNRLLFAEDGRPLVPLGMMQGQSRVVVEAKDGLVVELGEEADKPLKVPKGTPVVIEVVSGTPAATRELFVVETLEGEARTERRRALEAWRQRGLEVVAVEVGGVYGVKGTVVDNRATLIASTKPVDAALVDVRPVPIEWLDRAPSATFRVVVGSDAKTAPFVRLRARGAGAVLVRNVEHDVGYAAHGFEDRLLRDEVLLVPDKAGRIAVVNIVDENDMVAGVLPSEMFATAPLEALKAQAVTARGELFAKIGRRHFTEPYLVCSEQHCQVYKGMTAETARTNEAARTTAGELAFLDGHVVDSVYSACCGGHTEPVDVVWDRPARRELVGRPDALRVDEKGLTWLNPALASSFFGPAGSGGAAPARVPEKIASDGDVRAFLDQPREAAWCGRSTMNQKSDAWRWTRRFTQADLQAAFADLDVGVVQRLVVEERGPGGRLRALRVEGSKQTARVLRELPVRKRLKNLRSGLFVVDEERAADGTLVAVTLRGAGFGHGSGMCQQGAIGMAEAGATYRDILGHYYNGAVVKAVF
jgi:peptidoglycan hydrolase-like amidase